MEGRKTAQLEDPGADLLNKMSGFWERSGRILLAVVGGLAVVGVLGFFWMRSRAATENEAAGKLAEANMLFWQGQYDRSLQSAKQVAQQYGSTRSGVDAHRLAGDNAFWLGDVKGAISEYRSYLAREKSGLLADAVKRSLAYSLESEREFAEAAKLYDELVGRFDRESSAEFLAASARCYRELNQPAEAQKRLQRLVDEFGDSMLAQQARLRLAEVGAPR